MKEWFKRLFAVDNSINENTVMGLLFAVAFLVAVFVQALGVDNVALGILAGAMASFFGLSIGKR